MAFLHGVEVVELDVGTPRPIRTPRSSVIGLVGTATKGPVNEVTLITGLDDAVTIFGTPDGVPTIPRALNAIFDHIGGAPVFVVNVFDPSQTIQISNEQQTVSNDTIVLNNSPVSSVTVKSTDSSTTYTEGDYTVDTDTGVLTLTNGSDITNSTAVLISYDVSGTTYTDESQTFSNDTVTLSNSGSLVSNVIVKSADSSTTYTEGVYTVDTDTGVLTLTGASSISDNDTVSIDYTVEPTFFTKSHTFVEGALSLNHTYVSTVSVLSTEDSTTYTEGAGNDYTVDTDTGVVTLTNDSDIVDGTTVSISYKARTPSHISASEVSGGVNPDTGAYTGVKALLAADPTPRLLIAPGFTSGDTGASKTLVEGLRDAAERLRAIAIIEGPNTNEKDAIDRRKELNSERLYLVDPYVKVFDPASNSTIEQPASAHVAGVIAKSDNDRGFWWSPSNRPISGIVGTARPIDFSLGDSLSQANILNENDIATIINQDGYRLWGNRSCASDKKWAFISVRRTADLINDALCRAHLWAVDRNITSSYGKNVEDSVNDYLSSLRSMGAIINGTCWAEPQTPTQIAQGKVCFNFDFVPPYPAEHITFRSILNNDYLEEVFS